MKYKKYISSPRKRKFYLYVHPEPRYKVLKGAYIEFPVNLVGRRMCLYMTLEVDVVSLFQISALKRQSLRSLRYLDTLFNPAGPDFSMTRRAKKERD
jgi:hypothetical protein